MIFFGETSLRRALREFALGVCISKRITASLDLASVLTTLRDVTLCFANGFTHSR